MSLNLICFFAGFVIALLVMYLAEWFDRLSD